jgi:hypothetical protein
MGMPWSDFINAVGKVANTAAAPMQVPTSRLDGYSLGGMLGGSPNTMGSGATGGATGGAYGGAFSQSYIDGSNWVVSTGGSKATGTGTSGGNGGLSPTQTSTQGGVTPQSPFSFLSPVGGIQPTGGGGGSGNGTLILIGLAALAVYILRK